MILTASWFMSNAQIYRDLNLPVLLRQGPREDWRIRSSSIWGSCTLIGFLHVSWSYGPDQTDSEFYLSKLLQAHLSSKRFEDEKGKIDILRICNTEAVK